MRLDATIRTAQSDEHWRALVVWRDDYTCRFPDCGANTNLDAAHIIPKSNPKTRLVVDNGLTLCRTHHRWAHDHPRDFQCVADQIRREDLRGWMV